MRPLVFLDRVPVGKTLAPFVACPIYKNFLTRHSERNMRTHILSILSSPTLANTFSCVACQSTSYRSRINFMYRHACDAERTPTTAVWSSKTLRGSIDE